MGRLAASVYGRGRDQLFAALAVCIVLLATVTRPHLDLSASASAFVEVVALTPSDFASVAFAVFEVVRSTIACSHFTSGAVISARLASWPARAA